MVQIVQQRIYRNERTPNPLQVMISDKTTATNKKQVTYGEKMGADKASVSKCEQQGCQKGY